MVVFPFIKGPVKAPWSDPVLPKRLRDFLQPFPSLSQSVPRGLTPAAVLIPLEWSREVSAWTVYLIRRSGQVAHHRGQMAFPGGMLEPHETPADAALREAWEETRLPPSAVTLLGALLPTPTVTRFWVWPIVAIITAPWSPRPNPEEVEKVVRIPLGRFFDETLHRFVEVRYGERSLQTHCFLPASDCIWGATARMIVALVQVIADAYGISPPAFARGLEPIRGV